MAFTTINGASATDRVSFVGTDGVDILTTFNTLTAFVGAQGANDSITVSNPAGLIDWQVKAGAGNDSIDFNSEMIGGRVNGNAGVDTINLNRVVAGASVYGGQQDDFIRTGDVANSRVNGNLGNDSIKIGAQGVDLVVDAQNAVVTAFVAASVKDLIFASIFGGQGADQIEIVTSQIRDTEIGGNLGNDVIDLRFNSDSIVENVTVNGGDGDDTLRISGYAGGAVNANNQKNGGAGITFDGGLGNDTIQGSGRNDTIDGGEGADFINGRNGADKMTGGAGRDTFKIGGVLDVGGNNTLRNETIVVSAGKIEATDEITDWLRNTGGGANADAATANGDILDVQTPVFLNDVNQLPLVAADTLEGLVKAAVDAAAGGANEKGVWLGATGSASSYTAYAIVVEKALGAQTVTAQDVGLVQLGLAGTFTSANIGTALNAGNLI